VIPGGETEAYFTYMILSDDSWIRNLSKFTQLILLMIPGTKIFFGNFDSADPRW
jgi:hypothetical protein